MREAEVRAAHQRQEEEERRRQHEAMLQKQREEEERRRQLEELERKQQEEELLKVHPTTPMPHPSPSPLLPHPFSHFTIPLLSSHFNFTSSHAHPPPPLPSYSSWPWKCALTSPPFVSALRHSHANSVKVDLKSHLECKLCFPCAQFILRHTLNQPISKYRGEVVSFFPKFWRAIKTALGSVILCRNRSLVIEVTAW